MLQNIQPHTFDNTFKSNCNLKANDYVFHFKEDTLLLKLVNDKFEFPKSEELDISDSAPIYLFQLNGISCFLVQDCVAPENSAFRYEPIRFRNPFLQKEIDWTCSVALHVKNWYEQHQFCGKCGNKTTISSNERAVVCKRCDTTLYPSISPAIIVAIRCEDKILLARNAMFPDAFFSLVAGYVDVGESIEDAVAREVREEVGIEVHNIRYYDSQPWPFSGSMMIGFVANAQKGQTIKIDNKEIVEANWYAANELPNYPPTRSIAGEMIEAFVNKKL